MSLRRIIGGLCLALVATVGVGCLDELNKPEPPDAPPPVLAFEQPTGRLAEVPFSEILQVLGVAANVIEGLCGWDPVQDLECLIDQTCSGCLLTDLFMRALSSVLPSLAGEEVDGGVEGVAGVDGFLEVHQICPGFLDPAVPDPDNGFADLTIGFTGYGLDPHLWGTVTRCQYPLGSQQLVLDGDIALIYSERVPLSQVESTPVLFGFVGTITDGAVVENASVALRTRPDGLGTTEILVRRSDIGSFVVVISPDGIYVAAGDGYWSCDVVTETCGLASTP